jgi:hypothetical protein
MTGSRTLDGMIFVGMVIGAKMLWNKHAFGTWW